MDTRANAWDSKIGLAALFLMGYFALILILPSMLSDLDEQAKDVLRELTAPLGPVIGIISFAIWRTSHRDNVEAETNATVNRENAETVKLLAHKSPPVTTGPADSPELMPGKPRPPVAPVAPDVAQASPARDAELETAIIE